MATPEAKKVKGLVMALRAISEASEMPHVFGLSDMKRFADDALVDFEKKKDGGGGAFPTSALPSPLPVCIPGIDGEE